MAEKSDPPKAQGLTVKDTLHAPVIYFDGAPNFGHHNGVINLTLMFVRHLPVEDRIETDLVTVAHLRCSIQAAMDLRRSIDSALLLAAEVKGQVN